MSSNPLEFFLPERVEARRARLRQLLEAPESLVPVNDLRGWYESLAALSHLELAPGDAESLVATMGANYRAAPRTPLARAVTAITQLVLMDRFGVAVDAIPLDVAPLANANGLERAAAVLDEATRCLAERPRVGCVLGYWLFRTAALHAGLVAQLRGSSVAEVREAVAVVLDERSGEAMVTPFAQALARWRNPPADDTWVTANAGVRAGRWSGMERVRHALSGDTRALGWRGTTRLAAAVIAVSLAVLGLSWGFQSRNATRQFQETHATEGLDRLVQP